MMKDRSKKVRVTATDPDEFKYPVPKEESSGILRIALVLLVIVAGLAFIFSRYVGQALPKGGDQPLAAAQQPQAASATAKASEPIGRRFIVERAPTGHFIVTANIEGRDVKFMVDTGASHVVLSPQDAKLLGLDIRPEDFTQVYYTANGQVKAAPVTLTQVKIGPIYMDDVAASVNQADMGYSLLGQSFLNRLHSFEVRGSQMLMLQ